MGQTNSQLDYNVLPSTMRGYIYSQMKKNNTTFHREVKKLSHEEIRTLKIELLKIRINRYF